MSVLAVVQQFEGNVCEHHTQQLLLKSINRCAGRSGLVQLCLVASHVVSCRLFHDQKFLLASQFKDRGTMSFFSVLAGSAAHPPQVPRSVLDKLFSSPSLCHEAVVTSTPTGPCA